MKTLKARKFKCNPRNKNICRTLSKVAIVTFMLCIGVRLYLSNEFAVKNTELKELHNKKISLEKEISHLTYDDSVLSSLVNLEKKAEKLGFAPMTAPLVLLDPSAPVQVASLSR